MVEGFRQLFVLNFFASAFFFKFEKSGSPKQKKGWFCQEKHCQPKTLSKQHLFSSTSVGVLVFFWGGQEFSPMPRPKRNRDGEGASDFF